MNSKKTTQNFITQVCALVASLLTRGVSKFKAQGGGNTTVKNVIVINSYNNEIRKEKLNS